MAELLLVETPRVRVSWTGPPVAAADGVRVHAFRGRARVAHEEATGDADPDATLPLAIPEEATLSLLVQSRTGETVSVAHRDPSQISGLVRADGGRAVHGRIRVRDSAGWSAFTIRVGGRPEMEVVWPVVPVKLSAEEVGAMREEVEAAWTGAALAAWAAATEGARPNTEPSRPAWVALLREAVRRLGPATDAIARRPETALIREAVLRPAARLRGDASSLVAIRKGRGAGEWREAAGVPVREHVSVRVLRLTEDVAAHRWIRAELDRATRRLVAISREEAAHPYAEHGVRLVLRDDLAKLGEELRRFGHIGPLVSAAGVRAPSRAPLVLRRRAEYRLVFDALRLLDAGLGVAEGEVETAWLGTARLFETWAALTVVHEAARVLGAEAPPSPFGIEEAGARVRVRRGREATVRLAGPRGSLTVTYEPRFGGPPALLAQRPDLLLELERLGDPTRRAVLDAKYRRDETARYVRRHGASGPPEDALGDLHRYRDAIVDARSRPLVERAAALFPASFSPAFRESRLWRSHEEVGVGAVPLAPDSRDGLRAWLEDWVGE